MAFGKTTRARELLESGRFAEAAEMFVASGEMAAAARAFLSAKEYFRAAECYEKALKPLDAARLFFQTRHWGRAAALYAQGGDTLRAELATEQLKKELALATPQAPRHRDAPDVPWPAGAIWRAIRAGDTNAAVKIYLGDGSSSGWELIADTQSPEVLKALAETLFQARDHAVAAEAFHKAGEMPRAAQCLSLAGLNEEAAHAYFNLGEKTLAAQHLEKAHTWDQAAQIYLQEGLHLDAARCHERGDDPVKAAAMYLKAKKPDLALPLLQSVPPAHRNFAQCRLLAGKILFQKGQNALAGSMLDPLLETALTSEEGRDACYQAAVLLESSGVSDLAAEAYRRLQEAHFGFRDVTERLRQLTASGLQASPASEPAAPAPSKRETPVPPAVDLAPLRDCSLFNRLGNEDLRRLWMIGKTGECKPGKVILKAGEVAAGLMVVLAGGITITPDPSNLSLASGFLGTGDYVGLGSLLQGPPQPNALVAQAGTRLLILPLGALEKLLSAEPDMGMRFYRSIAEHLVQALMAGKARSPGVQTRDLEG